MFLRAKEKHGVHLFKRRPAQVTLEISIGLICTLLLIVASAKIFIWVNELLVAKQKLYESQRVAADGHSDPTPYLIDTRNMWKDGKIEKLNILEESQ